MSEDEKPRERSHGAMGEKNHIGSQEVKPDVAKLNADAHRPSSDAASPRDTRGTREAAKVEQDQTAHAAPTLEKLKTGDSASKSAAMKGAENAPATEPRELPQSVESRTKNEAEREMVARNFIASRTAEGPHKQAKIDECLSGIDLSKEVRIETLKPGDICGRYGFPQDNRGEHPNGGWLARQGVAKEALGVAGISEKSRTEQKIDYFVVTRDVQVLVSTAKDVPSWVRMDQHSRQELHRGIETKDPAALSKRESISKQQQGELWFGGGEQLYAGSRPEDLACFSRVVDGNRRKTN